MSKLCDHLWIEQNDKLRGDIIYCQRCDSLVSKEVFATINADAARIAELEAENAKLTQERDAFRDELFTDHLKETMNKCTELQIKNFGLLADCKAMAEGMIKAHRCTHSGEPESCLLDSGESCSYNNRSTGKCPAFGICTCPACTIATKYREG